MLRISFFKGGRPVLPVIQCQFGYWIACQNKQWLAGICSLPGTVLVKGSAVQAVWRLISRLRNYYNAGFMWYVHTDGTFKTKDRNHFNQYYSMWEHLEIPPPTKEKKHLNADSRETEFKPQSLLSLSIFFDGTVMCRKKTWGGEKWALGPLCVGLKLLQEKVNKKVLLQARGSSSTEQEKDNYALWSSGVALKM